MKKIILLLLALALFVAPAMAEKTFDQDAFFQDLMTYQEETRGFLIWREDNKQAFYDLCLKHGIAFPDGEEIIKSDSFISPHGAYEYVMELIYGASPLRTLNQRALIDEKACALDLIRTPRNGYSPLDSLELQKLEDEVHHFLMTEYQTSAYDLAAYKTAIYYNIEYSPMWEFIFYQDDFYNPDFSVHMNYPNGPFALNITNPYSKEERALMAYEEQLMAEKGDIYNWTHEERAEYSALEIKAGRDPVYEYLVPQMEGDLTEEEAITVARQAFVDHYNLPKEYMDSLLSRTSYWENIRYGREWSITFYDGPDAVMFYYITLDAATGEVHIRQSPNEANG